MPDPATCSRTGPGFDGLCAVWQDPDFDASARSLYYARIVENPSCRWSTSQCLGLPEDARPPGCNSARLPKVVQERAWTSPIWYEPQEETEQASLSIERRATSLEAVIETGVSRE